MQSAVPCFSAPTAPAAAVAATTPSSAAPPPSSDARAGASHSGPGRLAAASASGASRQPVSSESLFGPRDNEVLIDHHGMLYRLRVTALGKLILTK